jgi:prevent-host-death family protein
MTEFVVSVREFRSRLGHYLRFAREGAAVIITVRGAPVGRLVPIEQDLDGRIAALRTAGQLQLSGCRIPPRQPAVRIRTGKSVAELIIEDRGRRLLEFEPE